MALRFSLIIFVGIVEDHREQMSPKYGHH